MSQEDKNQDKEKVTIANIGGGALGEMFEDALKEVIDNVKNINTDAKKSRYINLKIEVVPDGTRKSTTYRLSASTKLQSSKAYEGIIHIAEGKKGVYSAYEEDPEQEKMDFPVISDIKQKS